MSTLRNHLCGDYEEIMVTCSKVEYPLFENLRYHILTKKDTSFNFISHKILDPSIFEKQPPLLIDHLQEVIQIVEASPKDINGQDLLAKNYPLFSSLDLIENLGMDFGTLMGTDAILSSLRSAEETLHGKLFCGMREFIRANIELRVAHSNWITLSETNINFILFSFVNSDKKTGHVDYEERIAAHNQKYIVNYFNQHCTRLFIGNLHEIPLEHRPEVDIHIPCDITIGEVTASYTMFSNLHKNNSTKEDRRVFKYTNFNYQALDNLFGTESLAVRNRFKQIINKNPSDSQFFSEIATELIFLIDEYGVPIENFINFSCWPGNDRTGLFITKLKYDIWSYLEENKCTEYGENSRKNFLAGITKPTGVLCTLLHEENCQSSKFDRILAFASTSKRKCVRHSIKH